MFIEKLMVRSAWQNGGRCSINQRARHAAVFSIILFNILTTWLLSGAILCLQFLQGREGFSIHNVSLVITRWWLESGGAGAPIRPMRISQIPV